jgi:hypothetical protein
MIYQGQAAFIVSPGGATVQMALSPDGSQLAYIANDETAADDAAYYAGGSNHQPPGNLYLIPTNSVTATGAATVLDSSGTGHGISNYDVEDGASAGNHLAFIDGGSDIVYDVSNSEQQTGIASADSVYLAPVGGGSPSVLIPGGGGDSWRVVGSASGNNSFACQEVDDGGYGWSADPSEVVQTAVCNNSGSVIANTSMTPASASGSPGIVVDYADNGS